MWIKIKRLIAILVLALLTDADLVLVLDKSPAQQHAKTHSRSV